MAETLISYIIVNQANQCLLRVEKTVHKAQEPQWRVEDNVDIQLHAQAYSMSLNEYRSSGQENPEKDPTRAFCFASAVTYSFFSSAEPDFENRDCYADSTLSMTASMLLHQPDLYNATLSCRDGAPILRTQFSIMNLVAVVELSILKGIPNESEKLHFRSTAINS
ncbi:hypothetical protein [Methylobacterium brachiatum]|uniref:hypothetical protein n=1 Tax=Methylobacterium brachiatum TaxID=269660 RepID=UPI0013CF1B8B|nr:hypothetical protein [Methylobacterium brachiatum]